MGEESDAFQPPLCFMGCYQPPQGLLPALPMPLARQGMGAAQPCFLPLQQGFGCGLGA